MYETILVPTDGSEGTDAALEHAIDLAKQYDATLHTLFVVDTGVVSDAGSPGVIESLESAGRQVVDDVVATARAAGVDRVEGSVREGVPHRGILDYAAEADVDLVVLGTHGRTGLDRYLLGSVAEKVVRLSEVPVLTVRMPEE